VRGKVHVPTSLLPGKNPGDWVCPRAGLNVLEKRNPFCPYWDSNSRTSSLQLMCTDDNPCAQHNTASVYVRCSVKIRWVCRHSQIICMRNDRLTVT